MSKPRTITVFRYDKVGDLLVSTPVMRCLRANYPDATLILVASPLNAGVLKGWSVLDDILIFDPTWKLTKRLAFLRELWRRRTDIAVVLVPRNTAYFLAFLSGARIRAGIRRANRSLPRRIPPLLLTTSVVIDRTRSLRRGEKLRHRHHAALTLDLARKMGLKVNETPLELAIDDALLARTQRFIAETCPGTPIIGLHLAVRWLSDKWSEDDVSGLIGRIVDEIPGASVLITAGPADFVVTRAIEQKVRLMTYNPTTGDFELRRSAPQGAPRRVLLVKGFPLPTWGALLAQCDVVITPDCGCVHMAAAVHRPVVVIYDHDRFDEAYAEWAPWHIPHHALRKRDVASTSAEIVDACRDLSALRGADVEEG